MNLKQTLTDLLVQHGVSKKNFSIDAPKNYVMNFGTCPYGFAVWFQEDGGKYSYQQYNNAAKAAYDFATRLTSTEAAEAISNEIAKHF